VRKKVDGGRCSWRIGAAGEFDGIARGLKAQSFSLGVDVERGRLERGGLAPNRIAAERGFPEFVEG
jgi:hypothetical protein